MAKEQPDLSIVIPAYHEEKRVGQTLKRLAAFLKSDSILSKKVVEVVVVVADSPDDTRKVVVAKSRLFSNFKLVEPGIKVGKGRDVKAGMLEARGAAIIFMDADLATPLKYLPRFYKIFLEGSNLVIATRNLRKHHPNLLRRGASNAGNILFRMAGGVWLEDSQCGFKLFSYQSAQLCFSKLSILGWGFDMEVLTIAKANGLTITPVRVNDWQHMPDGTFELGMMRNFMISLKDLAMIARKRLLRQYLVD